MVSGVIRGSFDTNHVVSASEALVWSGKSGDADVSIFAWKPPTQFHLQETAFGNSYTQEVVSEDHIYHPSDQSIIWEGSLGFVAPTHRLIFFESVEIIRDMPWVFV